MVRAQDPLSADYGRVEPARASERAVRKPPRAVANGREGTRLALYDEGQGPKIQPEPAPADDPFHHPPHVPVRSTAVAQPPPQSVAPVQTELEPGHDPERIYAAIEPASLPTSPSESSPPRNRLRETEQAPTQPAPAETDSITREEESPIPLSPRRSETSEVAESEETISTEIAATNWWSSVPGVLASLGLVLGLFFLLAWFARRGMPGAIPTLPKSVVEVLGRVPMGGRQQLQLMRVGNKLILLHLSLTGVETLTEIEDPAEIDRIAGLCSQGGANSSTRGFRDMLDQMGRERPSVDFLNQDHGLELMSSTPRRREESGRGRRG